MLLFCFVFMGAFYCSRDLAQSLSLLESLLCHPNTQASPREAPEQSPPPRFHNSLILLSSEEEAYPKAESGVLNRKAYPTSHFQKGKKTSEILFRVGAVCCIFLKIFFFQESTL